MKKLALTGLLIYVNVFCFGQSLDSLYFAYRDAKSSERRETGNAIVSWLGERYQLPDSLLPDSRLSNDEFERAFLSLTVRHLFRLEHYDLAYEASQTLLKLSKPINDTSNLIIAYYFMGFSCQRMGKMDEGLLHGRQCYELCLATQNEEMISSVVNNIANIYQINKQDSLAITYFQKSIDVERKLGRTQNLAIRLGNISTSYLRLGMLNEALSSATEGLELDRKEGRPDRVAIRLHQACEVYLAMEDYEKAKEYELEALEYFTNADSKYGRSQILHGLGNIERKLKNNHDAEKYYRQSLSFAEEINNKLLIQQISNDMYLLYRSYNAEQSLLYFERSIALRDSLFHEENQQQLNDFRVKYETVEKELEIVRQQSVIDRQKTRLFIVMGGLFAAGILVVLLIYIVALRSRRNSELTEMNAIKDKFFSIISHDLKNPAVAQRDALQALANNDDKWGIDKISIYHRQLLTSANGLVELLKNLLNWSQIQSGRKTYNPHEMNLVAALQPDFNLIHNMATGKGVTFVVQTPPTAFVTCDENMIATVVRNLLANAVKFTAKGGTITLDIRCRDAESHVSTYIISVSDTGTGMTEEQINNLFCLDKPQSRQGTDGEQGSGLGLIVCKELLDKHGSRLYVESEDGKGSRFWFELKP